MVTVHTGKRYKALIHSEAAISLAHTSVYYVIEDHYKTKILPAVVHLKPADGSSMSSLGKATLHLCITNLNLHILSLYVTSYQELTFYPG